MGICGPFRTDIAKDTQYCGMFLTPTLRNTATRGTFFHNGVYHNLKQVMDFYNLRNTSPEKIYPHDAAGKVLVYDVPAPRSATGRPLPYPYCKFLISARRARAALVFHPAITCECSRSRHRASS
jgi:cytochrome c peroxidase